MIGLWQIIIMLLWGLVWVIPCWKIFQRAGLAPALSLSLFFPIIGVIPIWIVANKRWPGDDIAERFD